MIDTIETKNKNFLIIYNPGGLGRSELEEDFGGWPGLIVGIRKELKKNGASIEFLTYQRCSNFLQGSFQMLNKFKQSAKRGAQFIESFLREKPNFKVLLLGGCYGGFYSLKVAELLNDKKVFFIATGIPFWLKSKPIDNGIIINLNGVAEDPVVVGNFKEMLKIFLKIPHPGHGYFWHDRSVRNKIKLFLDKIINDLV